MAGKTFAGMVYPDMQPLTARNEDVRRVHMFDIPAPLREHACSVLDAREGGVWFSVGEFRYEGRADHDTAVARRVLRNGRMAVEYGVEIYDYEG